MDHRREKWRPATRISRFARAWGACALVFLCAVSKAGAADRPVEAPVVTYSPSVVLPPEAEVGTETFVARLHLLIDEKGTVTEATLVESQGEVIDEAILAAAKELRFEPARVEGRPTSARIAFAMPLRVAENVRLPTVEAASSVPSSASVSMQEFAQRELTKEVEIVVTGARVPERKDRSVIATDVITRQDIRRSGATTVGEALEAHPSLQISRTFRGAELWIRGLDPEYTLVLVDGERVPGRIGGAIDLSRYPLENIERVEIVRGPSSALYGSDAIGGVVNIITRQSVRPFEADAEARVATENAAAGSARVAVRPHKSWGTSLSAGHQHTPSFRRDETRIGTSGSARTLNSAALSVMLGEIDKGNVRLSADYSRTRLEGVDEGPGGAVFDRTQLQEQSLFAINQRLRFRDTFLQNVAQYSHFRDQYLVDQRDAVALDGYEQNLEHLGQITTTVAHEWNSTQRTTLGLELLSQILDSPRLAESGYRVRYSTFAEHRWVALTQGAREVFIVVPGARLDVDSQFGHQLSPKLAFRFDPLRQLALRAGYGRGFRAPSFQELLLRFENPSVGYVVEGNPDLDAESSHSGDVSIEWRPGDAWFLSAAGFYNYLTGMIGTITAQEGTAAGTIFTYDNIDEAWTRGVETVGIWSPAALLSLTLGYTLMQTHDGQQDRPLIGRPIHRWVARAASKYEPWDVTLSARAALSLMRTFFEDRNGDGAVELVYGEPLLQADVRLEKAFNEHFQIFAGVDNIADAGDAYAALLPRQGYAGVSGSY